MFGAGSEGQPTCTAALAVPHSGRRQQGKQGQHSRITTAHRCLRRIVLLAGAGH